MTYARPFWAACVTACRPRRPAPRWSPHAERDLPGLAAGAVYSLDVMNTEQALALLHGVNGLAGALDGELEATLALVEACAYHPLALDLAAHRLLGQLHFSEKPVAYFTNGLKDRMRQLRRPGAKVDPLLSLEANFDLSYNALSGEDQRRFGDLAVFAPTGFGLAGAAAVWGEEEDTATEAIQRLESASLLLPGTQPGRWRLHDLLPRVRPAPARKGRALHAPWQSS